MTSSSHYARFIPSEEIDAQAVRHWKFGDVDTMSQGMGFTPMPELAVLSDLLPPPAPNGISEKSTSDASLKADDELLLTQQKEAEKQEALEVVRREERESAYLEGFDAGKNIGLEQGIAEGRKAASSEWQEKMELFQSQQGKQIAERLRGIIQGAQREVCGLHRTLSNDLMQLACDIARQVVRQEVRCNPDALLPVVAEALDMLGTELKPATVRLNPLDWEKLKTPLLAANPQPKIEWLADASVHVGDCRVESAGAQIEGGIDRRWQRAVASLGLVSTWFEGASNHGQ